MRHDGRQSRDSETMLCGRAKDDEVVAHELTADGDLDGPLPLAEGPRRPDRRAELGEAQARMRREVRRATRRSMAREVRGARDDAGSFLLQKIPSCERTFWKFI